LRALLGQLPVAGETDHARGDPPPLVGVQLADHLGCWLHSAQNGLSSIIPNLAIGCFDATSIASSRFAQSMMSKPPTYSFVSTNGPSVTSVSPSRTRTVVASDGGRSRSPVSRMSRRSISSTHAC